MLNIEKIIHEKIRKKILKNKTNGPSDNVTLINKN